MEIAKIGDTIEWSFPANYGNENFDGKTFSAEVVGISDDEKDYYVYASYGQDIIPVEQAKIINKYKYIGVKMDDGIIIICNKEPKPKYRSTANEQECSDYKIQYDLWDKNNELIKPFNRDEESKIIINLKNKYMNDGGSQFAFRLNEDLIIGFEVDCIEIRNYKMINGVRLHKPTKYAHLKLK